METGQEIRHLVSEEIAEHILNNVKLIYERDHFDKARWKLTANRQFTVKSAWQYIRHREEVQFIMKQCG